MYISGFVEETIVDGLGIRDTIYVSGCNHNCKGCHNPETHNFKNGKELTKEYKEEIINKIVNDNVIDGITFSGGDPLEIKNRFEVLNLIKEIRDKRPDLNIWIYTGYLFEDLIVETVRESKEIGGIIFDILNNTDVLVDGPFIESKKDLDISFRGSSNQRIIDVKKSLEENNVVELELDK